MRLRERTTWLKRRRRAFQFQSPGACHAERRREGRFEDEDDDDDSGGNDGLLEAGRLGAPGGKEDLYKNRGQVTNKSESLQKSSAREKRRLRGGIGRYPGIITVGPCLNVCVCLERQRAQRMGGSNLGNNKMLGSWNQDGSARVRIR